MEDIIRPICEAVIPKPAAKMGRKAISGPLPTAPINLYINKPLIRLLLNNFLKEGVFFLSPFFIIAVVSSDKNNNVKMSAKAAIMLTV